MSRRLRRLTPGLRPLPLSNRSKRIANKAADIDVACSVAEVANYFYGWYDDVLQAKDMPTIDPPQDGPCVLCGRQLVTDDVRTTSLMPTGQYAARCYFYRTHRTCAEKWPHVADRIVLDAIRRNGD